MPARGWRCRSTRRCCGARGWRCGCSAWRLACSAACGCGRGNGGGRHDGHLLGPARSVDRAVPRPGQAGHLLVPGAVPGVPLAVALMMGTTHAEGAAVAWLAGCCVWGSTPPETVAGGAVLAVLAALAVDIDHRRSMAAQFLHLAGLGLGLAAVLTGFAGGSAWHHTWPLCPCRGV